MVLDTLDASLEVSGRVYSLFQGIVLLNGSVEAIGICEL